ncbi:MAG: hypothetical protein AAB520_01580 [Patescibacteria group bacterium]
MDPKLSGLDPKLKEAYDRVMNGPSVAPQTLNSAVQPPPAQPTPAMQPQAASTPQQPQFQAPPQAAPEQHLNPTPAINSTIAFNAHNSEVNKGTTPVKKSGGIGKGLLIGFVILILLVIYAFVWIYILKLDVPFLPQL